MGEGKQSIPVFLYCLGSMKKYQLTLSLDNWSRHLKAARVTARRIDQVDQRLDYVSGPNASSTNFKGLVQSLRSWSN